MCGKNNKPYSTHQNIGGYMSKKIETLLLVVCVSFAFALMVGCKESPSTASKEIPQTTNSNSNEAVLAKLNNKLLSKEARITFREIKNSEDFKQENLNDQLSGYRATPSVLISSYSKVDTNGFEILFDEKSNAIYNTPERIAALQGGVEIQHRDKSVNRKLDDRFEKLREALERRRSKLSEDIRRAKPVDLKSKSSEQVVLFFKEKGYNTVSYLGDGKYELERNVSFDGKNLNMMVKSVYNVQTAMFDEYKIVANDKVFAQSIVELKNGKKILHTKYMNQNKGSEFPYPVVSRELE